MDTERLNKVPEPLLGWFCENARILPWREQNTEEHRIVEAGERSYRVWVSEIMLQQTRVEAVKPYYLRFMEELPDVASLAACPQERLLKLWEGLGYYNRVRNMQKAALIAVEKYGGQLPKTYRELLALPGIGSYTAGAIASIAHRQVVPAVDGNVLRVVSRITGSREDISRQAVKKKIEELLLEVMERKFLPGSAAPSDTRGQEDPVSGEVPCIRGNLPGTFNQALMELGAVVCLPGGVPDCAHCPVGHICRANETGSQMELPVKASKKARRIQERTVLVIRDSGRCAVRRRPGKGLLAGLYELPNLEGHISREEALAQVQSWGFSPIRITPLPGAKHIFSHIEWQMTGYMVLVEDPEQDEAETVQEYAPDHMAPAKGPGDGILFVETARTEREYPIPAAFAAYTEYLSIRLGQKKYTDVKGELE